MAMAAMTLEESADYKYERMLKNWNEVKGSQFPAPLIYDRPARSDGPAPKWRGEAQKYFIRNPPTPGYGIAQRASGIAWGFVIPERDEYSSTYIPDNEDEVRVKWLKGLLDELQAYDVESIDVGSLLHSEGFLFTFLRHVLSNKHACIRAKAAELITSMVQNHPTSQQLVIEGNGLQLLLHNFITDPGKTSRTKTLGAISALIRNNKSGITVFLRENGYEALRNALISGTVLPRASTYREVVNLIEYLRHESSLYSQELNLKFGDDSEVQEARKGGNSGLLVKNDDKLKQDNSKKKKKQFKLEKNEAPLNLGLGPPSPPATGSQIHQFL